MTPTEHDPQERQLQWDALCAQIALAKPHAIFKPSLFPDGNQWCALYGDNLQEGIAGFGDTPALAVADFDRNFESQTRPAASKKAQPPKAIFSAWPGLMPEEQS